jgi:CBS domain containing-hemolysin-like protein
VSLWEQFLLTAGLLVGNAFFVGAEFAVISARRSQIEPVADAGRRSARTAIYAMEHVSLMLACAQFGITVCSLGLGAVAEPAVAHLIEGPFAAAGVSEHFVHPAALVVALALVTYLHVVIGEMVPKNLALAGPDRVVLVLAPPLVAVSRGLRPVIVVLNALANGVLRLLRVEPKDEISSGYTAEEVQSIVAESAREGLLIDEHGLLTGALEFSDLVAADVMVPLVDVVCVPAGSTPAEVERIVGRTGFSRFPVATPEGEIIGYLHLKDVLYADDERHGAPIPEKRVRSLVTVAGGDEVEDALATMQRAGSHLARVIDVQGLTAGVVFLEDVLETLVGEVRDATQRGGRRAGAPPGEPADQRTPNAS